MTSVAVAVGVLLLCVVPVLAALAFPPRRRLIVVVHRRPTPRERVEAWTELGRASDRVWPICEDA